MSSPLPFFFRLSDMSRIYEHKKHNRTEQNRTEDTEDTSMNAFEDNTLPQHI